MDGLKCNKCFESLPGQAVLSLACNHVFCTGCLFFPFSLFSPFSHLRAWLIGFKCAETHFAVHKDCPKCHKYLQDPDLVSVDLDSARPLDLVGQTPGRVLQAAHKATAFWQFQEQVQHDRRAELKQSRERETRTLQESCGRLEEQVRTASSTINELRGQKRRLSDLVESMQKKLHSSEFDREAPIGDHSSTPLLSSFGGASPSARGVSPLARLVSPKPPLSSVSPPSILSRFSSASSTLSRPPPPVQVSLVRAPVNLALARPNSLLGGPRPTSNALRTLLSRRL